MRLAACQLKRQRRLTCWRSPGPRRWLHCGRQECLCTWAVLSGSLPAAPWLKSSACKPHRKWKSWLRAPVMQEAMQAMARSSRAMRPGLLHSSGDFRLSLVAREQRSGVLQRACATGAKCPAVEPGCNEATQDHMKTTRRHAQQGSIADCKTDSTYSNDIPSIQISRVCRNYPPMILLRCSTDLGVRCLGMWKLSWTNIPFRSL